MHHTTIPKILHQIHFNTVDNNTHTYFDRCMNSQEKYFEGWEHKVWTEEDFLDILSKEEWAIPQGKLLLEIGAWAFISDIIRVYALFTYGGVYADWDVEFVKTLPESLLEYEFVLGFEPYTISGVATAQVGMQLCMSKKEHVFWRLLYKEISTRIWTKEFNILPGVSTQVLELAFGLSSPRNKYIYYYIQHGIVIFPYDVFYPFMGTRVFDQNPSLTETQVYNTIKTNTIALHWEHSQMLDSKDQKRKQGWTNYLDMLRKSPIKSKDDEFIRYE